MKEEPIALLWKGPALKSGRENRYREDHRRSWRYFDAWHNDWYAVDKIQPGGEKAFSYGQNGSQRDGGSKNQWKQEGAVCR